MLFRSSPYGYSGPLSSTTDHGFLAAADKAFREYCSTESVVCEFIRYHPLLNNHIFAGGFIGMQNLQLREYVTVRIEAEEELQLKTYSPQNRNKLRKAVASGVKITRDEQLQRFDQFVAVYLENMRLLSAAPLYFFSAEYFEALRELVRTDGFLLMADDERGCLGATVFLVSGRYAHYFLASSTAEGKKVAAGNLLLHEGINQCRLAGSSLLHLGGGVKIGRAHV